MVHVYEFEVFKGEKYYLAFPFDLEGGTQGESIQDVAEMAADWLQGEMEHRHMHDLPIPEPTFGNEPKHEGGRVMLVCVDAGRDTVAKVLPSEAARMLGVSPGRVTQMMDAGKLEWFEDSGRKWVTVNSVDARLAEQPKAGRPKKEIAAV